VGSSALPARIFQAGAHKTGVNVHGKGAKGDEPVSACRLEIKKTAASYRADHSLSCCIVMAVITRNVNDSGTDIIFCRAERPGSKAGHFFRDQVRFTS